MKCPECQAELEQFVIRCRVCKIPLVIAPGNCFKKRKGWNPICNDCEAGIVVNKTHKGVVDDLKNIIKQQLYFRILKGGDFNKSNFYLFKKDVFMKYKMDL